MRWAFWRRRGSAPEAAPAAPHAAPGTVAGGRSWASLPAFRTTIRLSAPTVIAVRWAPSHSLVHRRRPRRAVAAATAFPPAPRGQVDGLVTVAEPVLVSAPIEEFVEQDTVVESLVPLRVLPVAGPPRTHPALTTAADEYVGAPAEPETPFQSVTEFERMMKQYTDESGELDMASLMGFSSSAAPPAMADPTAPAAAVARPEQVLHRPTLAQSRKLGLRPSNQPATAPDGTDPVELIIPPVPEEPVPPEPVALTHPHSPVPPVIEAPPVVEESTVELPEPPRRLGLGAPVASRPPVPPALEHRAPLVPAPPARQRQAGTPPQRREDEPDDAEHDRAPDPQPVAAQAVQLEPLAVEHRPEVTADPVPLEPVPQELVHRTPPPREEPAEPVPTFAEPVYRAPLDVLPPPAAPEPATWYEDTQQLVPSELVTVFLSTFGVDVTAVPVHRGRSVSRQAQSLTARAFTRAGQVYMPDEAGELTSPEAKPLLAHELVHAVQQQVLGGQLPGVDTAEGQELETAAVTAERWVRGESAPPLTLLHRHAPPAPTGPAAAPVEPSDVIQRAETDAAITAFLEMAREERRDEAQQEPAGQEVSKVASWALPEGQLPFPASQATQPTPFTVMSTSDSAAAGQAILDRLADLDAAVAALTGNQDNDVNLDDSRSLHELADRLYAPLRNRLRAELLVDRERAGTLADRR